MKKLFLLLSDAVIISMVTGSVTVIVSLGTLVVQAILNRKVRDIKTKQDAIGVQIDGQQTALMDMTARANKSEGKAEVKDELIEVLKQVEPLTGGKDPKKDGGTTDVTIVKNLDK